MSNQTSAKNGTRADDNAIKGGENVSKGERKKMKLEEKLIHLELQRLKLETRRVQLKFRRANLNYDESFGKYTRGTSISHPQLTRRRTFPQLPDDDSSDEEEIHQNFDLKSEEKKDKKRGSKFNSDKKRTGRRPERHVRQYLSSKSSLLQPEKTWNRKVIKDNKSPSLSSILSNKDDYLSDASIHSAHSAKTERTGTASGSGTKQVLSKKLGTLETITIDQAIDTNSKRRKSGKKKEKNLLDGPLPPTCVRRSSEPFLSSAERRKRRSNRRRAVDSSWRSSVRKDTICTDGSLDELIFDIHSMLAPKLDIPDTNDDLKEKVSNDTSTSVHRKPSRSMDKPGEKIAICDTALLQAMKSNIISSSTRSYNVRRSNRCYLRTHGARQA